MYVELGLRIPFYNVITDGMIIYEQSPHQTNIMWSLLLDYSCTELQVRFSFDQHARSSMHSTSGPGNRHGVEVLSSVTHTQMAVAL